MITLQFVALVATGHATGPAMKPTSDGPIHLRVFALNQVIRKAIGIMLEPKITPTNV